LQFLITGLAADPTSSEDIRHNKWIKAQAARCEIIDGLLYRRVPSHEDPKGIRASSLRLYVPSSLRHPYLVAFHDHLCHLGVSRMAQVLRARYYWPSQKVDVETYVRECHECTLAKAPFRKPAAPRGPPVGSYPFDRVFVDVLSMAKTHDYVKGSTGYSKLLVFIDSLSRWIEAVPFNDVPTSEQVLHSYLTEVVCRHGTPRELRSDAGSNFVSVLAATIFEATGTILTPTEAHHHEGVGLVERAQQTLVGLARATNGGGRRWADHLPFYLMSMRASPNRLTRQSPSSLLYGREIRLPSQIGDPRPVAEVTARDDLPESILRYAADLQSKLRAAWAAARDATLVSQSDTVGDTTRTHDTLVSFKVDDRVCMRKHGMDNKLEYFYSGPYRVTKVMSASKYELCDLENQKIRNEVHVSNLKPYYTVTDLEKVTQDEFLVDSLLDRRGLGTDREYKVKWRSYPASQATWVLRTELMRRCAELITEYDAKPAKAPKRTKASKQAGRPTLAFPPPRPVIRKPPDPPPSLESREVGRFSLRKRTRMNYTKKQTVNAITSPVPHYEVHSVDKPTLKYDPLAATFIRGEWYYSVASSKKGPYWPAHIFDERELQSTPFSTAREKEIERVGETTSYSYIAAAELFRTERLMPLVDGYESENDSPIEPVRNSTPELDARGDTLRPIPASSYSEPTYWL
jgi:hypothetical protein